MFDTFLLLDSSYLHRAKIDISKLSYKYARESPKSFIKKISYLADISKLDNDYYNNISLLQNKGKISRLITYESMNKYATQNAPQTLNLFGIMPTNLESFIVNRWPYTWTLWNEEIEPAIFYDTAMKIHDSQNIVIDEHFMDLPLGRHLLKYISSNASVIVLGKNMQYSSLYNNIMSNDITPQAFINKLFS